MPEGTTFEAEECYGSIMIIFNFTDPRPSRNTYCDASVIGHVFVGPRAGINSGYFYRCDLLGGDYKAKKRDRASDFLFRLSMAVKFASHPFYA